MLDNKTLAHQINGWIKVRQEWLDILVDRPDSNTACTHIMNINSKIELLRGFWNWNDDSVDMPH